MTTAQDATPSPVPPGSDVDPDSITAELTALDAIPLADQVPVFERLHARLSAALAATATGDR